MAPKWLNPELQCDHCQSSETTKSHAKFVAYSEAMEAMFSFSKVNRVV